MTREAANIIKSECYACNLFNLDWTTKVNTALDVAVESLEKQPCNDAISKSDVFESMDGNRALPPVTPERPKGHWINIDKTHSKCDKCESVFEIASANGEANYCPNCGCFMSEGGKYEH